MIHKLSINERSEHWHTLAPQLPGYYHSHVGNTMMPRQFYQVNSITRINQFQEYAGPCRVFAGEDTYGYGSDSESDSSGEEDDGCHETLGPPPTTSRQHNNQKHPNHCRNNKNASAANCLTRVS